VGPSLQWNIFSGRRVRSNIEAFSSRARQALLRHDQAVLLALEDCEVSLTRFAHEQDRLRHLTQAVEADRRAVELATDRHAGGIGDFLTVLVNQRELYDAEDALIQSRTALVTSTIATFKSLGGGWPAEPEPGEPSPEPASP
jgi:multidrug efflux system outer membrane protein